MMDDRGFTLVEMLVVLTIIGLLAAVALPRLARPAFVDRARLHAGLADAVSRSRLAAAQGGQPVAIPLERLTSAPLSYRPAIGTTRVPLVFPDGTTSGGVLLASGKPMVAIDWMTGRLTDAPR